MAACAEEKMWPSLQPTSATLSAVYQQQQQQPGAYRLMAAARVALSAAAALNVSAICMYLGSESLNWRSMYQRLNNS